MHRIVGTLSNTYRGGIYTGLERFAGQKDETYGRGYDTDSFLDSIANARLFFLGELHSIPQIVSMQMAVIERITHQKAYLNKVAKEEEAKEEEAKEQLLDSSLSADTRCEAALVRRRRNTNCCQNNKNKKSSSTLHLIMEHFSFDMQGILEDYQDEKITFEDMVARYKAIGSEGHNLRPYRPILEHAQKNKECVKLHAGFLSRRYARMLMKESEESALKAASEWIKEPQPQPPQSQPQPQPQLQLQLQQQQQQVPKKPLQLATTTTTPSSSLLVGNDFHYNLFESMLSGRNIHTDRPPNTKRNESLIYKAQLLKDVAMAQRVSDIIHESGKDDTFVVIAGNGHVSNYQGVPERVLNEHPDLINECCLITSHPWKEGHRRIGNLSQPSDSRLMEELEAGPAGANPADYFYVYEDNGNEASSSLAQQQQQDDENNEREKAKKESVDAYDRVGETAHHRGNAQRARAIMEYLRYTPEEIEAAGPDDVYNYQGVGNPHLHARIRPGDVVLDVGSGLGVDSFVAVHKTKKNFAGGKNGAVIGMDISAREVEHANRRAKKRGLDDRLMFVQADMERMDPIPDDTFDVVISNGAFCLAPNKEAAFREIFRVLKPGGRISVCTSTIRSTLHGGVEWPICMKMFIPKSDLQPLVERIGFTNVFVDDTDSKMVYELEIPEEEESEEGAAGNDDNSGNCDGKSKNSSSNNAGGVGVGGLNPDRHRIHSEEGNEEYKYLEEFDMDQLCARVCVVARKPLAVEREEEE